MMGGVIERKFLKNVMAKVLRQEVQDSSAVRLEEPTLGSEAAHRD
jgi:hypothetical protein